MGPGVLTLSCLLALAAGAADIDLTLTPGAGPREAGLKTADLVLRLDDPDTAVRRGAFKALAAEFSARTFSNDVLPPLRKGLTDPDAAIRRDAAFSLAGIASKVYMSSGSAAAPVFGRKVIVDFSRDAELRAALLEAMRSPDPKVRKYAPLVLGLAFPKAADIEAALAARWAVETSTPARQNIVVAVSRAGYSSESSKGLLNEALRDPDRVVRIRARRALKRLGAMPR